ncbi:MAG: AAA family ATPase [Thermoguttaceae bacterium]|nr:AAA family ATPase [Thermoguttaceae bacterium]
MLEQNDENRLIYERAEDVYYERMTTNQAVEKILAAGSSLSIITIKIRLDLFSRLIEGKEIRFTGSASFTKYYLERIGCDYDAGHVIKALLSHLAYFKRCYSLYGDKNKKQREVCAEIGAQYGISFGDEIFAGIQREDSYQGVKCWLYSPGERASNWQRDLKEGVAGINWDAPGDFSPNYTYEEIRQKTEGSAASTKMIWNFAHEIKPGDYIFAKKGRNSLVGLGIVKGECFYNPRRSAFKIYREVQWLRKTELDDLEQSFPLQTLYDFTRLPGEIQKLFNLYDVDEDEIKKIRTEILAGAKAPLAQTAATIGGETVGNGEASVDAGVVSVKYDDEQFLKEVYVSPEKLAKLKSDLKRKKNLILQGAPGVGKTFAARRLAYVMMGERDRERVEMVQFHQSYAYEDFIQGYRPTNNSSLELRNGAFYEFCERAREDDRDYFFIIDEINRGNLSKIFGELLQLLEADKRGSEVRLLYANKRFSIPENVYVIGLMNAADRSLALVDYALRRRFAFHTLRPAFESDRFQAFVETAENPRFQSLVDEIKKLNRAIADDPALGEGFQIGHSYFCADEIDDEILENIVESELLPLLEEYWFDDKPRLDEWSDALRGALK